MAIYSASGHKEVLDAILAENTFEYPLTLTNTKITKVVVDVNDPSKARVTVDGIYDSGVGGFTSVNMNRIDVAKLVTGVNTIIKSTSDTARKVSDVLPAIADQLGIELTANWIVDETLVLNDSLGDRPLYGASLTIAPDHPVLYGSFDFKVDGIILDINRLITVTEVDCLVDNSPHETGKYNCSTLIYANDYTAVSDELSKIPLSMDYLKDGELIKLVANAIGQVDGIPWIYANRKANFNLYDSWISKHCRTVDFVSDFIGVNTDYSHVIMIWNGSNYGINLGYSRDWGLLIHYDRLEGRE